MTARDQRVRTKVLLIAGLGRSGSTLLELLLSSCDGFTGVGELVHLNDRAIRDNQLCGCGVAFSECAFWTEIGTRAFGGWENIDGLKQHQLRRSVDRNRKIARLVLPTGAFRTRVDAYADYIGAVYKAVAETSGASVVIDSSKHPSYAFLLRRVRNIELYVVHLVRDPRGVAYSWTKSIERPEIGAGNTLMPRYGAARIATRWSSWNLLVASLRIFGARVQTHFYEDLVGGVATELKRICEFVGTDGDAAFTQDSNGSFELPRDVHSVSGNPMRFGSRHVTISADDAWREALPYWKKILVSSLTLPSAMILRMISAITRRNSYGG